MENLPIGNFEVLFYDGVKFLTSKTSAVYNIKIPEERYSTYSRVDCRKSQEADGSWKFQLDRAKVIPYEFEPFFIA